jgi:hypothetical protein
MGERTLSIRQLAQEAGVSTKTLRYWETQGLLAPAGRTHTNYRRYTETHVERALFIRKAQSLGVPKGPLRRRYPVGGRESPSIGRADPVAPGSEGTVRAVSAALVGREEALSPRPDRGVPMHRVHPNPRFTGALAVASRERR